MEKAYSILSVLAFFFPNMHQAAKILHTNISNTSSACKKYTACICSVDNRSPRYSATQSSKIASELELWKGLRISAKSAYMCENEYNNSIVHVAVSILQSSRVSETSNRSPETNVCHLCGCLNTYSFTSPRLDSSVSTSLINSHDVSQKNEPNLRQLLRTELEKTREQLCSCKSPLQQETQGFSSWTQLLSHVRSAISPFSHIDSASPLSLPLFADDVAIKRQTLHRRICRINKWHLLLRLHHMPWLRLLRRHALVHPPLQPHLAWRCTTLLLSGQALQGAVTDMSTHMFSMQDLAHQADADKRSLGQRMAALDDINDIHLTMISFLRSEMQAPKVDAQERMFGCKCCCGCSLPCKKK
jgi:hypothetical protein